MTNNLATGGIVIGVHLALLLLLYSRTSGYDYV